LIEKQLKVNGYDIDVIGIVSNIVYVRWFEDLRLQFLDTFFPFEDMFARNQSPILSRTEVEYRYPLTIYDRPVGRVWVERLERARWHVAFEIESQGKLHCFGKQSGYFYDIKRKRPIAIPEELKRQYEEALADLTRRERDSGGNEGKGAV